MESKVIDVEIDLELHKNQQTVDRHGARFKALRAGKRFGKTTLALKGLIKRAGMKVGGIFNYIAPTYGMAEDIAWRMLMEMIPYECIEKKWDSSMTLRLAGCRSEIQLKGTDNPDRLRGPASDGYVLDEYDYMPDWIWSSILRGQLKQDGFATFISSPNRYGRSHFKGFWERAKERMEKGDKEWGAWYYTIYDNPILLPEEIEKIRMENTDTNWRLEYLAEWSEFAGKLFTEFSYERNVEERKGEKFEFVRGIDYGRTHPCFCLWAGVDLERRKIWIIDEYKKSGLIIRENCRNIISNTKDDILWTVIDPAARKHEQTSEMSIMDAFFDNGVPVIPGDNTDRGYDILKMFLKLGVLKIDPRCKELIHELENVQWGDDEGEDGTDTLRYLCAEIYDRYLMFRDFYDIAKVEGERVLTKDEELVALRRRFYNLNNFRQKKEERESEFEVSKWMSGMVT